MSGIEIIRNFQYFYEKLTKSNDADFVKFQNYLNYFFMHFLFVISRNSIYKEKTLILFIKKV